MEVGCHSLTQGWAPVAAGTCVASVLGAEMTGEPVMLAMGCCEEEVMEVMPERRREEERRGEKRDESTSADAWGAYPCSHSSMFSLS